MDLLDALPEELAQLGVLVDVLRDLDQHNGGGALRAGALTQVGACSDEDVRNAVLLAKHRDVADNVQGGHVTGKDIST